MDELEAIRQRRIQELQAQQAAANQDQASAQAAEHQRAADAEAALEGALQKILTPEARERLTRIRMSRPELADVVSNHLVRAAQSGRLPGRIGDEDLRHLLSQLLPQDRDTTITRK